ncbi:uncharacterized protein LOC132388570 [Hypanus sabinus]|uniref:uncharacterized protein LOC132388570 n=1 Tax=Hypanus sabinus TaxID=79690 RepID=UPI0028C378EC|nr:uncharacterized protein LOC132388570 [Hypanus sabinus]
MVMSNKIRATDKGANVYTDSRYTFGVALDFGQLWAQRRYFSSCGPPVQNATYATTGRTLAAKQTAQEATIIVSTTERSAFTTTKWPPAPGTPDRATDRMLQGDAPDSENQPRKTHGCALSVSTGLWQTPDGQNLSALNYDLSDLKRRHRDLRHQFTEMETKYRSVIETKAQICELLTSRREQIVSKDWIKNKYRRYYVSTFETTFRKAIQECSKRDSRLLEINSTDEADCGPGPPVQSVPGAVRLQRLRVLRAQKQNPKQNIGNRPDRRICLLLLVTIGLVAIVVGLSIYVSQTRHFLITSERNYQRLREQDHEMNRTQLQYQQQVSKLNSTLKSRTSENTRLDLSQRNCQKNLSALSNNLTILENNFTTLNSDLSDLNRKHSDLCHQFNQLEIKYRNINENKAQICQYLARRRETTCPHNWIKKEDRCYFISEITKSYDGAMGHCSEYDSRLLEIDSDEEKKFVSSAVYRYVTYWIGKCADRNVASDLLYELNHGSPTCTPPLKPHLDEFSILS